MAGTHEGGRLECGQLAPRVGTCSRSEDWRRNIARLTMTEQSKFHDTFSARFEALLDNCHGECVLRRPELAKIVGDSLLHFDGERYVMTDFVVMPNSTV